MSKDKKLPKPQDFGFTSFARIFSHRAPIPGETPGSRASFHAAMIRSLAPCTPYEMVIAENLIAIEWELLQHRRMRDQSLRGSIMKAICDAVVAKREAIHRVEMNVARDAWCAAGKDQKAFTSAKFDMDAAREAGSNLARQCMDPEVDNQSKAHAEIESLGIDLLDLMSEAYHEEDGNSGSHDNKIQELERRRRSVKADLDALQKVRPIEAERSDTIDAEVLEP